MAKTILELPFMPNSCRDCVLSTMTRGATIWACAAFHTLKVVDIHSDKRADFCPLKLVEDKEVE